MFFAVSKIGWYLLQPLVGILVLQLGGILFLALRMPKTGFTLLGLGTLALVVATLTPLGLLMMSTLENRFPRPKLPENVAGIVVLGGSFDTRVAMTRGEVELNDASDRVTGAMALAIRYPNAKVVFSGGSAAMFAEDVSESSVAQRFFASLGLAPERLILEDRSRNTFENAVFSKQIAQPEPGQTWLLVTSASHMPRAVGCFRQAGFDVVPVPVDYQTPSGSYVWVPSTATIRNVEKIHFAIREYLGLFAYWMSGKTDALLPAPRSS